MFTKNLVEADLEWLGRKLRPGVKRKPTTVVCSTPSTRYPSRAPGCLNRDKQEEVHRTGHIDYAPSSRGPAGQSVDESITKGPRLCWVWNSGGNRYLEIVTRKQSVHNWHRYITESGAMFEWAELVTRKEIDKYLEEA